jgi:hypothetical protein
MAACKEPGSQSADFAAYYTSYGSADDITGPFADVLVRFTDGKRLVFSRESSYLPFLEYGDQRWSVEELIPRLGDGDPGRPDRHNIYSYVRIIQNNEEEVLIHWRYVPDFAQPGFAGVVHEYFTVRADGSVSRTIQAGRENLTEFNDPGNTYIEEMKLTHSGIRQLSLQEPNLSKASLPAVKGVPVLSRADLPEPVLQWSFDEGLSDREVSQRDITMESKSGTACTVDGNLTLWKAGVSGSALAFDGYHSKVTFKNARPANEDASFTLEAWVALGAYPWKEGAIMDISDEEGGVYMGISDLGKLVFMIHGGEELHTLRSAKEIDLYKWTHVAASYDKKRNEVIVYIDGKEEGRQSMHGDIPTLVATDIVIGLNKRPKGTTQHVSKDYPPEIRTPKGNHPMIYGIEGLIDEAAIYVGALDYRILGAAFNQVVENQVDLSSPALESRVLPGKVDGENADRFRATYTSLPYHELWDNLWRSSPWPDVVVRFDQLPCNVVFWRGPNYGAGWVTENNRWMSDQSAEIMLEHGCSEHMADKQNRFSHVRILENSDARVVVHWRYASADVTYAFKNYRTWTDEYYYIYPDGIAVRHVNYHDGSAGWQDVQFFAQPGSTPEDQIHLQALTVANLEGETHQLDWTHGVPENALEDASISVVNLKSEYKVVVIYPDGSTIGTWGEMERATPETHFAGPWNHWPVGQMPNDGRYALRSDRVTHSALGGANPRDMALYGFTKQDISTLVPVARFWNHPPVLEVLSGAVDARYDKAQKAYVMDATGADVSLAIEASDDSPLKNPCFVIRNWKKGEVQLSIDGKDLAQGDNFRYGFVPTETGYDLIVWIQTELKEPATVFISK